MKAPRLLKNESTASFRTRVAMWEKRTGKKYPKSGWGTREERALSNRIKLGDFGQSNQLDYSKDYNLDDQLKEESLAGGYAKYKDSKEGKEFIKQQLTIQEAIDQDKKENFAFKASKGLDVDTSQVDNAVDTLNKLKGKNKQELSIPNKETKNEGYEDEHPLSDPDYNRESTKKNKPIKRGAIERENVKRFGEDVVDKLKIKHADWKKARKSGTLDKWRKKYGVK